MTREEIKQVKMTNQEAIEILRDTPIDLRSPREDDIHTLYAKAQMMAIEALQERPKGRWVELPCELGDTVYVITSAYNLGLSNIDKTPCIYEGIVKGVMFHENLNHQIRLYSVKNIMVWYEKLADFGKTVFLTEEEAEKALADMRESE